MATPPDFTAGQILTAAQMNAVGLWLVKTQTIGSAVTSVAVTNAFTSDFDNYKIVVSGSTGSANVDVSLQLTGSTTGYSGIYVAGTYATGGLAGFGDNNAASFTRAGAVHSGNSVQLNVDLAQPNLAKFTYITGQAVQTSSAGTYTGVHKVSTAFTGFTLIVTGGANITGGTIAIYGYNLP
jgi:hypothetical protein